MARELARLWYFIWHDNSLLSWIVNVVIAIVLVKFVIYPGLGLLLSTSYPVVAVVSGSMEHNTNFETWWEANKNWYINKGITKDNFKEFLFSNGFNKGDIMVIKGAETVDIGDVVVYQGYAVNPIIHRVVHVNDKSFETKGDHNPAPDGYDIKDDMVLGKAIFKIPYLGWVKIIATELVT